MCAGRQCSIFWCWDWEVVLILFLVLLGVIMCGGVLSRRLHLSESGFLVFILASGLALGQGGAAGSASAPGVPTSAPISPPPTSTSGLPAADLPAAGRA